MPSRSTSAIHGPREWLPYMPRQAWIVSVRSGSTEMHPKVRDDLPAAVDLSVADVKVFKVPLEPRQVRRLERRKRKLARRRRALRRDLVHVS